VAATLFPYTTLFRSGPRSPYSDDDDYSDRKTSQTGVHREIRFEINVAFAPISARGPRSGAVPSRDEFQRHGPASSCRPSRRCYRSEEHTSELQSREN